MSVQNNPSSQPPTSLPPNTTKHTVLDRVTYYYDRTAGKIYLPYGEHIEATAQQALNPEFVMQKLGITMQGHIFTNKAPLQKDTCASNVQNFANRALGTSSAAPPASASQPYYRPVPQPPAASSASAPENSGGRVHKRFLPPPAASSASAQASRPPAPPTAPPTAPVSQSSAEAPKELVPAKDPGPPQKPFPIDSAVMKGPTGGDNIPEDMRGEVTAHLGTGTWMRVRWASGKVDHYAIGEVVLCKDQSRVAASQPSAAASASAPQPLSRDQMLAQLNSELYRNQEQEKSNNS